VPTALALHETGAGAHITRIAPGARELDMNLRQLRYFTRIVEAGNITRAAEQLYVAQPALGMQIRQLEDSLGVELLSRHSRGVTPTRAGQALYERACEILSLVQEAEQQVASAGRFDSETVVLGLTNGFANIVGRDFVLRARSDFPQVRFELVEERSAVLVEALERHEIDLALAYEVHERPGLLRVPLVEEEMLLVTRASRGKGRLLQQPIEFSEVARRELVMPGKRDGVTQQVLETAKRLALDVNVVLDVSSIATMRRMVAYGDAAAVMPYGNVVDDLRAGILSGRRIVNPPIRRTLYLIRSLSRALLKREEEILALVADATRDYARQLASLAKGLEALDRPLHEGLERVRTHMQRQKASADLAPSI
jgi:LysR family nitrogen assimilation transcriptional regulator